jgi:hypothetical protein
VISTNCNDGAPPRSLGLPLQAAGADYRNALERARQHWTAPRRRNFNRRPQSLEVEVCAPAQFALERPDQRAGLEPEATVLRTDLQRLDNAQ